MLRKLALIAALVAALMFPADAFARGGMHGVRAWWIGGGHFSHSFHGGHFPA